MKYTDFAFQLGEYGKSQEYYDENAIILAVRNILLSKPGNFPFNPSIGMNIKQYQFELFDKEGLNDFQIELNRQIAQYIPDMTGIDVQVRKVYDENNTPFLGIAIKSIINSENISANFLIRNDGDLVNVFNEIN